MDSRVIPLPLTIRLFVSGVVRNPLNTHGATRARIAEGLRWKQATRVCWLEAGQPQWAGPMTVQLTAYVTRLWDSEEGLGAAVKYVRDEAVRLILDGNPPRRQDRRGHWYPAPANDGPKSGHVFQPVRQEIRPARRGVLVEMTPR